MDEVILVDKPAGMTSFGVVARIRRVLTQRAGKRIKVGHTGTLDPFATGLMVVLAGKQTKNAEKYSKLDKVYEATIKLGETSTTGDPEGEIRTNPAIASKTVKTGPERPTGVAMGDPRGACLGGNCWVSENSVLQVVNSFIGEIEQTPPAFSAIKINGQRAYKLAREGKNVEMPSRKVTIYDIRVDEYIWPLLKITAHVSSGTYIRTLAEDIGKALGVGAYTTQLRRIKVGNFDIKNASALTDMGIDN